MYLSTTMKFIRHRKLAYFVMSLIIALTLMVVTNAVFIMLNIQKSIEETPLIGSNTIGLWIKNTENNTDFQGQSILDRNGLLNIAGIEQVSFTSPIPYGGGGPETKVKSLFNNRVILSSVFYTDDKLLETLDLQLTSGRNFTSAEVTANSESSNVVMINSKLAQELFDGENVAGQSIEINNKTYLVIGVIDTLVGANASIDMGKYTVLFPETKLGKWTAMLVKYNSEVPSSTIKQIEDTLLNLSPSPTRMITSIDPLSVLRKTLFKKDLALLKILSAVVFSFFLISFATIMGVVKFNFAERVKSFGIQRALGMTERSIRGSIFKELLSVTLFGSTLGLLFSWILSSYLTKIYAISSYPFVTFLQAFILLSALVALTLESQIRRTLKKSVASVLVS